MKNKQTAVEWLEKELKERYPLINSEPLFEQALKMEQEQLAKAEAKGADEAVESLWRMMNDRD